MEIEDLAAMMLQLQDQGCQNINVVTPTHYSPHMVLALDQAARQGLRITPCLQYLRMGTSEVLEVLDGIVDIYLADFKYMDAQLASTYSGDASDYPAVTRVGPD